MIKKLSLFFSAIAIGILSIFGSISTKNTAEPNYFLQNTEIEKAVVNPENTNQVIFYLDNNFQPDNELSPFEYYMPDAYDIFLIDTNKNLVNVTLNLIGQEDAEIIFYAENPDFYFVASPYEDGLEEITFAKRELNVTNWLGYNGSEYIEILAFVLRFTDNFYNLNGLNETLNPVIGNLTSLEQENTPEEPEEPQQTTLEQISTIISDIINWFTNILSGSSEIFYANNELTAWGTVLFIGVAIMLISICLKWVISLVRGI